MPSAWADITGSNVNGFSLTLQILNAPVYEIEQIFEILFGNAGEGNPQIGIA
ncbi:hypothetical protein D1872_347040 [compost metagenome]